MIKLSLIILALSLAAGCQSKPNSNTEQDKPTRESTNQPIQDRQVRQRDNEVDTAPTRESIRPEASRPAHNPSRDIPKLAGELHEDGYGLLVVIDGASPNSFLTSLEMIASQTSEGQYQRFHDALEYLKVFGLHRDMASFYKSLDGQTGEEIIERIERHRVPRS